MAQFDGRRTLGDGLVVDCQSDLPSHLDTRLIVPSLPASEFEMVARRLNPIFTVEEVEHILYTQFAATIPTRQLNDVVANLDDHNIVVVDSLDVLLTGV